MRSNFRRSWNALKCAVGLMLLVTLTVAAVLGLMAGMSTVMERYGFGAALFVTAMLFAAVFGAKLGWDKS